MSNIVSTDHWFIADLASVRTPPQGWEDWSTSATPASWAASSRFWSTLLCCETTSCLTDTCARLHPRTTALSVRYQHSSRSSSVARVLHSLLTNYSTWSGLTLIIWVSIIIIVNSIILIIIVQLGMSNKMLTSSSLPLWIFFIVIWSTEPTFNHLSAPASWTRSSLASCRVTWCVRCARESPPPLILSGTFLLIFQPSQVAIDQSQLSILL